MLCISPPPLNQFGGGANKVLPRATEGFALPETVSGGRGETMQVLKKLSKPQLKLMPSKVSVDSRQSIPTQRVLEYWISKYFDWIGIIYSGYLGTSTLLIIHH